MFSRVLFATDLSPASDLALDCIAGWKGLGLSLSHVTIADVHAGAGGMEDALRVEHAPKLERQAQHVREAGVSAAWRLEFGVPYLNIERIAREEGAELVVLGSHGASWVREVWLGSIADAILRHVQLPVMVIKVNQLIGLPREQYICDSLFSRALVSLFGRALVATDFSADSDAAIEAWRPRLVVVGRHGRGKGGRRLIGSTSHDVARESPAPVLVVPEG